MGLSGVCCEQDTLPPASVPAAPTPAPVAPQPAVATSAARSEQLAPFGIKPVRVTGLKTKGRQCKNSLQAQREHPAWACVEIVDETDAHQPLWRCLGCDEGQKKGGASRITNHLLGLAASKKCDLSKATAEFEAKLQKVTEYVELAANKKARKEAVAKVNAFTGHGLFSPMVAVGSKQGRLQLDPTTSLEVDEAIAEFFYGCNISAHTAEHVLFKKMVHVLKSAPPTYKPPTRQRLYGKLLDDTTARIRDDIQPTIEAAMSSGCTLFSDGWDTAEHNHLINMLYGNCKCIVFDGTVELTSDDVESATFMAELMRQCIERIGRLAFVQVVTDTCATMKAAWRLLVAEYPWITTTCCGPHTLSLELKDLAKLPDASNIISKVQKVLSLFWGRRRWPRKKLCEVIQQKTGKKFGLYRGKATRFAGKFREMSRMLRVKSCLQAVVVSEEYQQMKFTRRGTTHNSNSAASSTMPADDDDDLDPNIGQVARDILLDEAGFWKPMTIILYIALPLLKLLRAMDGTKPVLGKVYYRMYIVQERLQKLKATGKVPWIDAMIGIHKYRWKYLHSDFHAAAYALDPEFIDYVADMDHEVMDGLGNVIAKMCLRDTIALDPDCENTWQSYSMTHPAVVERTAQAEREFQLYKRKVGAFSKPTAAVNAKQMTPGDWWDQYGSHCPILCSMAPRVLDQPGSASCAERNWSIYGQIRAANRGRMGHPVADKLVFCHESLHLRHKLQDAGYAPEIEQWDSDEESEEEDDEQDFIASTVDLTEEAILLLCA